MATNFAFRQRAVRSLTTSIGVYVLCDLDEVPIYVGKSTDGIRRRVARHLTSARSDIIANRQIDVWEIAHVWAYPVDDRAAIAPLEAQLFAHYNAISQLMNGAVMISPTTAGLPPPAPAQRVQVMHPDEVAERLDPVQRLPRQAAHYAQAVGHFLAVKNSSQIARALNAHFLRLKRYHGLLLGSAVEGEGEDDE